MKEIKSIQEFELVLKSDKPTFVDFWAEWCGPCRMVGPVVEELALEYGDKMNFIKVNVDTLPSLASKYHVFSIPTLTIFKDGELVTQKIGAATKVSFKEMIKHYL